MYYNFHNFLADRGRHEFHEIERLLFLRFKQYKAIVKHYKMAIEVDPSSPSYSLDGPSSSSRRTPDDELVLPKKQRSFPVEIPVLLLFLSWNLTGTVFQYQILYQTCTVSLGFNETECSKLGQGDSSQALQVNDISNSFTQPMFKDIVFFLTGLGKNRANVCNKDFHVQSNFRKYCSRNV